MKGAHGYAVQAPTRLLGGACPAELPTWKRTAWSVHPITVVLPPRALITVILRMNVRQSAPRDRLVVPVA